MRDFINEMLPLARKFADSGVACTLEQLLPFIHSYYRDELYDQSCRKYEPMGHAIFKALSSMQAACNAAGVPPPSAQDLTDHIKAVLSSSSSKLTNKELLLRLQLLNDIAASHTCVCSHQLGALFIAKFAVCTAFPVDTAVDGFIWPWSKKGRLTLCESMRPLAALICNLGIQNCISVDISRTPGHWKDGCGPLTEDMVTTAELLMDAFQVTVMLGGSDTRGGRGAAMEAMKLSQGWRNQRVSGFITLTNPTTTKTVVCYVHPQLCLGLYAEASGHAQQYDRLAAALGPKKTQLSIRGLVLLEQKTLPPGSVGIMAGATEWRVLEMVRGVPTPLADLPCHWQLTLGAAGIHTEADVKGYKLRTKKAMAAAGEMGCTTAVQVYCSIQGVAGGPASMLAQGMKASPALAEQYKRLVLAAEYVEADKLAESLRSRAASTMGEAHRKHGKATFQVTSSESGPPIEFTGTTLKNDTSAYICQRNKCEERAFERLEAECGLPENSSSFTMRTGGCAADVWHTKKLNVQAMIIDHQPAKVRGDQLAWGERCGVSRGEWRDSGYGVPVIAPLSSVRGVLGDGGVASLPSRRRRRGAAAATRACRVGRQLRRVHGRW
jgi:hypothetical protein